MGSSISQSYNSFQLIHQYISNASICRIVTCIFEDWSPAINIYNRKQKYYLVPKKKKKKLLDIKKITGEWKSERFPHT